MLLSLLFFEEHVLQKDNTLGNQVVARANGADHISKLQVNRLFL